MADTGRVDVAQQPPEVPSGAIASRLAVPWFTVLSLAVVMAYATGFWLISLRGAVGAIERTQGPFATWLRESTLALPFFVFAVLGALTLALRRFGPVLRKPRTVAATALLVVAAGTLVGVAAMVASSAYDYQLQSNQLQFMHSAHNSGAASVLAAQEQATLDLHVRGVLVASALLLVTNLVLVGWVVAFRGGRLDVSSTRHAPAVPAAATPAAEGAHSSRADDLRLLLVAGLFGSAAIHAAVVPEHLAEWTAAGVFFIILTAAEVAVGGLLLARLQPTVLLAAAVVSIGPLMLWLYSRTLGLPFGPEPGVPEAVGLADCVACVLEVGTLLLAVVLLRARGWLGQRPPVSAHARALTLVAVVAVTFIGLGGSGLAWLDVVGNSGEPSVAGSPHSH